MLLMCYRRDGEGGCGERNEEEMSKQKTRNIQYMMPSLGMQGT